MPETTLCRGCRHRLVSTLRAAAEILADPAAGSAASVAAEVAITAAHQLGGVRATLEPSEGTGDVTIPSNERGPS